MAVMCLADIYSFVDVLVMTAFEHKDQTVVFYE